MATGKFFKHWPTILLGVIVAAILLVAVFSFQLNQTESAVVTTFGRPTQVTEPGLHFLIPSCCSSTPFPSHHSGKGADYCADSW